MAVRGPRRFDSSGGVAQVGGRLGYAGRQTGESLTMENGADMRVRLPPSPPGSSFDTIRRERRPERRVERFEKALQGLSARISREDSATGGERPAL